MKRINLLPDTTNPVILQIADLTGQPLELTRREAIELRDRLLKIFPPDHQKGKNE